MYPEKPFETIQAAREWVHRFVSWYNGEHRHSALRFVTPNEKHQGLDESILAKRVATYNMVKQKTPQRWSRDIRNWSPIKETVLNPDRSSDGILKAA